MSRSFLLDTNILSDLMRNPRGKANAKLAEVGEDRVSTSIIVAAELRFGAAKKRSIRLAEVVEDMLDRIPVLTYEAPADEHYAGIRAALELQGQVIGGNDMLIAAQVRSLDLTLVTDNVREFSRIEGLKLENWLR